MAFKGKKTHQTKIVLDKKKQQNKCKTLNTQDMILHFTKVKTGIMHNINSNIIADLLLDILKTKQIYRTHFKFYKGIVTLTFLQDQRLGLLIGKGQLEQISKQMKDSHPLIHARFFLSARQGSLKLERGQIGTKRESFLRNF